MPARAPGHGTASPLEVGLCEELSRQDVPHEHGSLHFRVRLASGETARFDPAIVVRRGPVVFLLEALTAPLDGERVALLAGFLEQHSPEIVLVAVAPRAAVAEVPPAAYDEVYADDEIPRIVARLQAQGPDGFLEPFRKTGRPRA